MRKLKRKKGQKISKAKKHIYKGISFDSGLEVYAYKQLIKSGLIFKYEPDSFILKDSETNTFNVFKKTPAAGFHLIKSRVNQGIKYTTDFAIYDSNGNITDIIETKGYVNERFTVVVKLFYSYASKHLPSLENFFMPSNQASVDECIRIILSRKERLF